VPLSKRAAEILKIIADAGGFIFHAGRPSMPLYDAAMRKVLRAMGYGAWVSRHVQDLGDREDQLSARSD
jgi:hypothetical protein